VDVICTALGAGIYTPGTEAGCTVIGSTGMHMRAARPEDVALNDTATGYVMCLPIPGMVAQMQSNMAATLNMDWLLALAADLLGEMGGAVARADLLARVDGWIGSSEPAGLIYHPYISEAGERGPFVDSAARASLIGLNLGHRFPDLVRAVAEGLGLAARDCYAAMGPIPAEVRLTGGAARSRTLRGVLAACLDRPVRASTREEAGAAGAAMMAAVATRVYADMEACIADWVTPALGPAEDPDPDLAARYAAHFPAYLSAREALAPVWTQLKEARA
jgi:erythritol kinase